MKHIIQILFIFTIIVCKAQIVPYDSDESIYIPNSGAYYKDTNNNFSPFVGEWKWENTATNSLITFIFKKEENISDGEGYTYDLLVGEYKYIENGIELANTLTSINNPNIAGEYHKISGIIILTKYSKPQCDDCDENEKRLKVSIVHDNYEGVYGDLILRHIIENGIEKIAVIISDGAWLATDNSAPNDIDIPFGTYTLIKQ